MCRNSTFISDRHLEIAHPGGLTRVISIVLGTVNLQFQGRFVSISLRPILGTVAAYVMATAWSSYS